MQVDAIVKRCNEFICEYLPTNPSSPLLEYIYTYEMGISPEEILLKVKSQLESVYTETLEKYVFLRTTFTQLLTIISNRELNARDEYAIVKCIVMWVLYDVEDRLTHANSLLELIDCSLCSKSMMLENKSINTNVPLLDKLLQQLHIKISILNDECTKGLIRQYAVERINAIEVPREVPGAIKSSSKSLCHVSEDGIYNTATKERLVQYNFGEVNYVIYTTKQLLFIFSFSKNKIYKYNNATKEVVVCSYPKNYGFNWSPCVNETSDGRLVVIGSWWMTYWYCTTKVIYYDIANDSWSKGQSLPYAVGGHAAVVDGDDIYVIGGNVNNVIRYRNGTLQILSPLLNNRYEHIAMLDGNCIYVYGGNRTDCECYDILTDQWSVIDNAVYTNIKPYNSVIDVNKRLLYIREGVNVYSISLDNNIESLLYENVSCHQIFLMPV